MVNQPLTLPALRGSFGSWIYYACLIPISEMASRVRYAQEIHPDKALSALIQRVLEGPRSKHISDYIRGTEDRFFNSMVLATYKGSPEWLEVGNFAAGSRPELVASISEQAADTIGFLRLSGSESIFAVDGQHRLAGIKRALEEGYEPGGEQLPVVFVGHRTDRLGLQRSRRLFTTLNKTAVAVVKRDIIALDEDDAMAITARRLVEANPDFRDPKIAVISSQNIPVTNRICLTTIANLYDVLKVIFKFDTRQTSDRSLRFNRPPDERLDEFYQSAVSFFDALGKTFRPVGSLFGSSKPAEVTSKFRGPHGGHLLFRPLGLDMVARTAVEIATVEKISLTAAVASLKGLPVELAEPPFRNVLWSPGRHRLIVGGKALAHRLVRYMADLPTDADVLRADYREALVDEAGGARAKLPSKIR